MKETTTITVCFGLSLLLLCGLIVYRKSHPRADAGRLQDSQLATTTNPDYQKQEQDWLANPFELLYGESSLASKLDALPIRLAGLQNGAVDSASLHQAVNRIVQSLLAKTFEEYMTQRSVGESFVLNNGTLSNQGALLQRFFSVAHPPANPFELHRLFWSKTTGGGSRATLWKSASWRASWIECTRITSLEQLTSTRVFADTIRTRVPNCGIVAYPSSFDYGPNPKDVFSKDGSIMTALAYLLVKTSEEKAYPLVVQFYWAPSCSTWLPTHLAVGYVGSRQFDPVF